jgi:hypothetical protein
MKANQAETDTKRNSTDDNINHVIPFFHNITPIFEVFCTNFNAILRASIILITNSAAHESTRPISLTRRYIMKGWRIAVPVYLNSA